MNNLKTILLLAALAVIFAAVGALFFDLTGAAVALAVATVINFWNYWHGGGTILAALEAREIDHATEAEIVSLVHELAAKAQIPPPRIFVIDSNQPNAFAVGPNPPLACLVLTVSLRRKLCRDELAAVIGHELAHIKRRDTLSRTIGVTMVSAIAALALVLTAVGLAARRRGGCALIAFAILAPLISLLVMFTMSRSQEYGADRLGAELCGDPEHLIAALHKLGTAARRARNDLVLTHPATASLFIVDPIPDTWGGRLFASHPPLEKRIARLRILSREQLGSSR